MIASPFVLVPAAAQLGLPPVGSLALGALIGRASGAALLIDYGHAEPRTGSTLQAVRAHAKVDPLAAPGDADLTAHVDFVSLTEVSQARGARWLGTVPQGTWLKALGIDARCEALSQAAPQHRQTLKEGRDRLVDAEQMGELFKVMGLTASGWPPGAGF